METLQPRKTMAEATRMSIGTLWQGPSPQNAADLPAAGDRVAVGSAQMRGTVRFFGPTQFSAGDWVGIELDEPHGKNDGSVKGVRYFECQPMKGLFVRPTALMKMKSPRSANGAGNGQVGRSSLRNSVNAQSRSLEDRAARRNMSVRIVDLAEEVPAIGGPSPANSTSTQFSSSPANSALSSPDKPGTTLQAIAIDDESDYEEEKKSSYNKRTSLDNLQELDWTSLAASPQMETPSSMASPAMPESKRPPTPASLKESPMEDRKMALICLERRHKAQKELADAVEDHDVDRIRKLLPMATNLGVPPSELESAQKIYNFEVQQSLLEEIEDVRSVVKSLAEAVKAAEVRAAAVERVASTRRKDTKETLQPAKAIPTDGKSSEAWLAKVGEKLEERVWQGLEQRLEEAIRGAVRKATQELVSVASEIRHVRAPVSEERRPSAGGRAVPGEMDEDAADRPRPGEMDDEVGPRPSLAEGMNAAPSNDAVLEEQDAAAIKMQAAARARMARQSAKVERERQKRVQADVLKEKSAVRIQKTQRARLALKAVNGLREVAYCKRLVLSGVVKREIQAAVCESEKNALASIREIHRLQASMEAARVKAQQRIDKASTKIQAVHRGNSARRTYEEKRNELLEQQPIREKAIRRLQLAAREWQGRRRDGTISDLGTAVFAARRKHAAWAAIFDRHLENGSPFLSKANFQAAISSAHPRVSEAQAFALWNGYVVGTSKDGVDLRGFAGIAEAIAIGDDQAAEFADLSRDRYLALAAQPAQEQTPGQVEAKKPVPEAIKRFQRVVNRWMARRRLHGDFDMYTAFRIERARHKAWVAIFKQACDGRETANKAILKRGLLEVHPNITDAQVTAIWNGFETGTGRSELNLETYCAIIEAIFIGTDHIAEFADMSSEAFDALGVQGGDRAATAIQARFRGRQSRLNVSRPVVPKLNLPAVQEQAPCEEPPEPARLAGPVQESAPSAQESAAMTLQRIFRKQQARRRVEGGGRQSIAGIALLAKRRYGAWVSIFEEACRAEFARSSPAAASGAVACSEGDRECTIGEASNFETAMREIHPQLGRAQANALWNGYCGSSYYMRMQVSDFCAMAEAIACGDEYAAEYADIPVHSYRMLSSPGSDAAAVRIQARYRGKKVRESRGNAATAPNRDQVEETSQAASQPAPSSPPEPSRSTDPREDAARILQRNARRWQARRRVPKGQEIQFAHAVNVVRSRHAAWSGIFDSSRSGRAGLDEAGLRRAVSEIYPQLSRGQVSALWQGFEEGTDGDLLSLKTFCSILQAVAIGDDAAAEFADISEASWVALKTEN